jgi:hypothetical protein
LRNDGQASIDVTLSFAGEVGLPSGDWRRLHVLRSETVTAAASHPVASVEGRGRLAGVCLMLEGHADETAGSLSDPFNFLEGDELVSIDGEVALAGTGTEDYLDSAFYFEEGPFATAFAQAWGMQVQAPDARVSACRWHLLNDALEFSSGIEFELEVGAAAPQLLNRYRSLAFVYR